MISRIFIANSTYSLLQYTLTFTDKIDIYAKDFCKLIFVHPDKKMGNVPYVDIEKIYGARPFNWKRIPIKYFYQTQKENA